MGNNQSAIDPVHLRMYSNIIQIKDPMKRLSIINTCLASMEYVSSAKRAGIYSYLLNYVATVKSGGSPPLLPGEQHNSQQVSFQQQSPTVITGTSSKPINIVYNSKQKYINQNQNIHNIHRLQNNDSSSNSSSLSNNTPNRVTTTSKKKFSPASITNAIKFIKETYDYLNSDTKSL